MSRRRCSFLAWWRGDCITLEEAEAIARSEARVYTLRTAFQVIRRELRRDRKDKAQILTLLEGLNKGLNLGLDDDGA